jgi:hypothetical protein
MPDDTGLPEATSPPVRARVAFAMGAAAVAALGVFLYGRSHPARKSDFDQVWAAAQALLQGRNPYEVIGIGKAFEWKWPFYYPLPAPILVAPLGFAPVLVARSLFSGVSVGALAWGMTRDGWYRWPLLLSVSFLVSLQLVQWSPLFTAALFLPSLAWIGIVKPNWAIAIVASASSTRLWKPLLIGCGILIAAAFLVQPGWVADWLGVVRTATHFRAPVTLPFGFLMLGAVLRWRRPEARLLVAMACLPQTPGFYDALMLFVIPLNVRESLLLTAASWAVFLLMAFREPWSSDAAWMSDIARFTLWCLYLPCVAMVLVRPNEGTLPVSERLQRMVRKQAT